VGTPNHRDGPGGRAQGRVTPDISSTSMTHIRNYRVLYLLDSAGTAHLSGVSLRRLLDIPSVDRRRDQEDAHPGLC